MFCVNWKCKYRLGYNTDAVRLYDFFITTYSLHRHEKERVGYIVMTTETFSLQKDHES